LADRYSRTDDGTNELIDSYGSVIKKYSKQYGLDWRLIFALMKQESMFGEGVESERGAFGLMQLMPRTGEALASRLGLEEVFSPRNNIAAGIYYLWEQYDVFGGAEEDDRIRLTLASYNCGLGHILDAQEIVKYLKENPNSWQSVSMALPLLSKQFYTLHRLVWGMDKPGNGYFEGSKQTTNYVKSVIEYYEQFKVLLH
jgi:membrane-bound lytic murein transglycosylase F